MQHRRPPSGPPPAPPPKPVRSLQALPLRDQLAIKFGTAALYGGAAPDAALVHGAYAMADTLLSEARRAYVAPQDAGKPAKDA